LADAIVNVQTVKTFAHEPRELRSHRDLNQVLTDSRIRDWSSAAREGSNRIAVLLVMQLIFVVTLVWLVQRDPSIIGVGIFAFSFITMMSVRLFQINIMLRQIEDSFLNASPMTEVMLQQPEIQDAHNAQTLEISRGAIQLKNVGFRYADAKQDNQIFSKLSLNLKPGEKVGLVGPSGGGKSTLTRLLLRFEDIEDGSITIDGQDISAVTQESLRQAISYVPQEPLLFHRTIAENIAYGRPDATIQEIEKAAASAYADDFIKDLPEDYDTIVGERGVKLSGGQRQRIAIARAILKDAPILILDEATSALDSESEVYIQKALWKLMESRTTIVIAHRLSTIQKMDRILVLEDGTITEEGSHKQLLQRKGTYAKLWSHQSGGFIED
jgi:ATP-binding cassette subfamily B protein